MTDDNELAAFELLRRRRHLVDAELCAFDLIELDGENFAPAADRASQGGTGSCYGPRRPGSCSTSTSQECGEFGLMLQNYHNPSGARLRPVRDVAQALRRHRAAMRLEASAGAEGGAAYSTR